EPAIVADEHELARTRRERDVGSSVLLRAATAQVHATQEILAIAAELRLGSRCRIGDGEGRLDALALAARRLAVDAHGRATDLDGISRLTHDAPDHQPIFGARFRTHDEISEPRWREPIQNDEIPTPEGRRHRRLEVRVVARNADHPEREEP